MAVGLLVVSLSVSANDADKKRLAEQAEQFQQGLTLAQKGSFEQALKIWNTLDESGELVPELKRAIENNIAVIYMKQNQYENAKKRLDSALQADPQVAITLDNLNQIYAYDAQKAYQKIFKDTPVNQPKTKWLYFDVKQASLPTDNVITDVKNADSVRLVKKSIEQWRQAWVSQDVKSYLSFYDKANFIPKDGMRYSTWEKSRYRSLQNPKFIKIFLDDIQITPISDKMIRTRFLQRYHSDRFKDDVYKVLLWNKKDGVWKIVQEVVMYDQK
ncbi:hypothetical protein [Thiomicrorhabdus sp.]|uniref:L,D-transpeptidase Cds6 family protein n=1 Tax=Thiomicrorhabdus sp. TaxID=2039724 RepID=UPI002AA6CEBE|nr:hypothetical protein [Thiomicrorhabdus sp.]